MGTRGEWGRTRFVSRKASWELSAAKRNSQGTWGIPQCQDFSSPWFFCSRSGWERTLAWGPEKSVPLYPAGRTVISPQPSPHHDSVKCSLHVQSTCKLPLVKNFNKRKRWREAVKCAEAGRLQQRPDMGIPSTLPDPTWGASDLPPLHSSLNCT